MTLFLDKAIRRLTVPRQLVTQPKRFRGKINIQRPQKPFYERALVTEFVTPFYDRPTPLKPIWEACARAQPKEEKIEAEPHPYKRILAREIFERFESSKMVGFLHKNSISGEDSFDLAVALHRKNMTLKSYGHGLMKIAVGDTRFENILQLFNSPNYLVFGAEPEVAALQKIVKRFPQVVLIAGILEGRLLHLNDFLKYGNMDITEARSGLVHTLQTAGGLNLNRQLNCHQSTLVSRLDQIGKGSDSPKIEETKSEENTSE
ncbi:39S ribosomal protein L10, mitochondrial [Venturia canescens]|uniref:39S ribosomal protein L10, mitochondrial n=1 Tax=Venturia canescens TaxID=32260 RepID=UPI001C9CE57B|nr:39S ribosomal protein L10, mitochondrial [Venturia canescens]